MRYASKVKQDPKNSLVWDLMADEEGEQRGSQEVRLTTSHKLVLLVMGLLFAFMIYG